MFVMIPFTQNHEDLLYRLEKCAVSNSEGIRNNTEGIRRNSDGINRNGILMEELRDSLNLVIEAWSQKSRYRG